MENDINNDITLEEIEELVKKINDNTLNKEIDLEKVNRHLNEEFSKLNQLNFTQKDENLSQSPLFNNEDSVTDALHSYANDLEKAKVYINTFAKGNIRNNPSIIRDFSNYYYSIKDSNETDTIVSILKYFDAINSRDNLKDDTKIRKIAYELSDKILNTDYNIDFNSEENTKKFLKLHNMEFIISQIKDKSLDLFDEMKINDPIKYYNLTDKLSLISSIFMNVKHDFKSISGFNQDIAHNCEFPNYVYSYEANNTFGMQNINNFRNNLALTKALYDSKYANTAVIDLNLDLSSYGTYTKTNDASYEDISNLTLEDFSQSFTPIKDDIYQDLSNLTQTQYAIVSAYHALENFRSTFETMESFNLLKDAVEGNVDKAEYLTYKSLYINEKSLYDLVIETKNKPNFANFSNKEIAAMIYAKAINNPKDILSLVSYNPTNDGFMLKHTILKKNYEYLAKKSKGSYSFFKKLYYMIFKTSEEKLVSKHKHAIKRMIRERTGRKIIKDFKNTLTNEFKVVNKAFEGYRANHSELTNEELNKLVQLTINFDNTKSAENHPIKNDPLFKKILNNLKAQKEKIKNSTNYISINYPDMENIDESPIFKESILKEAGKYVIDVSLEGGYLVPYFTKYKVFLDNCYITRDLKVFYSTLSANLSDEDKLVKTFEYIHAVHEANNNENYQALDKLTDEFVDDILNTYKSAGFNSKNAIINLFKLQHKVGTLAQFRDIHHEKFEELLEKNPEKYLKLNEIMQSIQAINCTRYEFITTSKIKAKNTISLWTKVDNIGSMTIPFSGAEYDWTQNINTDRNNLAFNKALFESYKTDSKVFDTNFDLTIYGTYAVNNNANYIDNSKLTSFNYAKEYEIVEDGVEPANVSQTTIAAHYANSLLTNQISYFKNSGILHELCAEVTYLEEKINGHTVKKPQWSTNEEYEKCLQLVSKSLYINGLSIYDIVNKELKGEIIGKNDLKLSYQDKCACVLAQAMNDPSKVISYIKLNYKDKNKDLINLDAEAIILKKNYDYLSLRTKDSENHSTTIKFSEIQDKKINELMSNHYLESIENDFIKKNKDVLENIDINSKYKEYNTKYNEYKTLSKMYQENKIEIEVDALKENVINNNQKINEEDNVIINKNDKELVKK